MTARYWVLVADELLESVTDWPAFGLELVRKADDPAESRLARDWCLFEDANAPAELDGKRVELTVTRTGDRAVITDRKVIE